MSDAEWFNIIVKIKIFSWGKLSEKIYDISTWKQQVKPAGWNRAEVAASLVLRWY